MYVHVTSPDKYSQAHLVLRHSTASVYSTNREQMLGRPRKKATLITDTVVGMLLPLVKLYLHTIAK